MKLCRQGGDSIKMFPTSVTFQRYILHEHIMGLLMLTIITFVIIISITMTTTMLQNDNDNDNDTENLTYDH